MGVRPISLKMGCLIIMRSKNLFRSKLIRGIILFLLIIFLLPLPVNAANGSFDLALQVIESRPATVKVGQETFFSILYTNRGENPIPIDKHIGALLVVTAKETNQTVAECEGTINGVAGLEPGQKLSYLFQDCGVIFETEGAHTVRVVFAEDLAVAPRNGEFVEILDDSDRTNNGKEINVDVGPFESALPEELGRLFAGLGMFFAVMAIVAVGTEVVIDTVKVSLGMKSKVTALEALAQMEKYMPGQLATVGVSSASQSEFRRLIASLNQSVIPVSEIPAILEKVKSGDLAAAVAMIEKFGIDGGKIQELFDSIRSVQTAALNSLNQLQKELTDLFDKLSEGLGQVIRLSLLTSSQREFLIEVEKRLEDSTTKMNALHLELIPNNIENLNQLPDNLKIAVQEFKNLTSDWQVLILLLTTEVEKWSARATVEWLTNKRDELLTLGRQEILNQFDREITPQLRDLEAFLTMIGFNNNLLMDEAHRQVNRAFDLIENETLSATDEYLYSLEKLLEGVEKRRNLIQSPARKLWRRFRESPNWYIWFPFGSGLIVFLSEVVFNLTFVGQSILSENLNQFSTRIFGGLIDGVLVGLILFAVQFGLAWVGQLIYKKNLNTRSSSIRSINVFEGVEIIWNWLRGDNLEPETFGTAKEKIKKVQRLTVENAAQIVFERSDQQRDEESSRLRWMRVISVIMGFVIAYLLQVDAAKLLDAAVPGIQSTINQVLYISGDTLHAWQPWLSTDRAITAGIILTAFAAAAGSTFWHDRLDQLQAAKKGAETAAQTIKTLEGVNNKNS